MGWFWFKWVTLVWDVSGLLRVKKKSKKEKTSGCGVWGWCWGYHTLEVTQCSVGCNSGEPERGGYSAYKGASGGEEI